MKKILHIQVLPLLSGVQNMMMLLLQGLEDCEIHVAGKPGGPLVEAVRKKGYIWHDLSSLERNISPWEDLRTFWHIYRLCRTEKFDIVHTHSSKAGFLGRVAAKLAGTKLIVHTVHGFPFYPFQNRLVFICYYVLDVLASLFGHKMVFVCKNQYNWAKRFYPFARKKAVVVKNAVNISGKRSRTNRDFMMIGSVMRFDRQKNVLQTVSAAIEACRKQSGLRFLFIGDGQYYPLCKKMVALASLSDRITLTGWLNDVPDQLRRMDVFMLYSLWEGLPLSILEAMCLGLPVLASDISGNNELVTDGFNGVLVKPNDREALIKALIKLPEQRRKMAQWGQNSLKRVEGEYSYRQFIDGYRRIYGL